MRSEEATHLPVSNRKLVEAEAENPLMSHLLEVGLVRKLISNKGVAYEATDRGLQLIAEYESLQKAPETPGGTLVSNFRMAASPFTQVEMVEFLRSLKKEENIHISNMAHRCSMPRDLARQLAVQRDGHDLYQRMLRRAVIVIPALNEEVSIRYVLQDLRRVLPDTRVCVLDGNSTDRTREVAGVLGAQVIDQAICSEDCVENHSHDGHGKGAAVRQALLLDLDADPVILMDADCSMRPQEIPQFITRFALGADMVKGSRFLPGGSSEDLTPIRRFGARLFAWLVNLIWGTNYSDLCYGFVAFRREAARKLIPTLKSSRFEIETEICIKAAKLGLTVFEVPSTELKRYDGKSRLDIVRDGPRILYTIAEELLSSVATRFA
jgi:hypothetical protein